MTKRGFGKIPLLFAAALLLFAAAGCSKDIRRGSSSMSGGASSFASRNVITAVSETGSLSASSAAASPSSSLPGGKSSAPVKNPTASSGPSAPAAPTKLRSSAAAGTAPPEVYVGACEPQYKQQLLHSDQWEYVLRNAGGISTNFHLLDSVYSLSEYKKFAELFANKNAFLQSDMSSSVNKEQGYIDELQNAGFAVPYTSESYGWSAERQQNLKTWNLLKGQKERLCFVQQSPWAVGGDILGEGGSGSLTNAAYRSWARQADGMSTDGPMGYWKDDQAEMREGSCSMVKYSHSLGKKAVVTISPYGAGISDYSESEFLSVGESCVRSHEDSDAEPDVWSVFEYGTSLAAVPEQQNGAPANTTTGMAYYLLKHLNGDPGTLDLSLTDADGRTVGKQVFSASAKDMAQEATVAASTPAGASLHYTLRISNTSGWCDYAGVLRATGSNDSWVVKFSVGDTDITSSVISGGFKFYQKNRLTPASTKTVDVTLTRTSGSGALDLNLELLPHTGAAVMDALRIAEK